jgi:hypothetical protein
MRRFKNNRTVGDDSIRTELIKGGGRILWRKFDIVIESVWKEEQKPGERNSAITSPIHEKYNKRKRINY